MKFNALIAAMFFVTSLASCGAVDSSDETSDVVSLQQAQTDGKSDNTEKKCKEKKSSEGCGGSGGSGGGVCGTQPVPADYGQPCGCGGTVICGGVCSAVGAPINPFCYAECGGVSECNGTCTYQSPPPAAYKQPCGCGGTVQCNGTCNSVCQ